MGACAYIHTHTHTYIHTHTQRHAVYTISSCKTQTVWVCPAHFWPSGTPVSKHFLVILSPVPTTRPQACPSQPNCLRGAVGESVAGFRDEGERKAEGAGNRSIHPGRELAYRVAEVEGRWSENRRSQSTDSGLRSWERLGLCQAVLLPY